MTSAETIAAFVKHAKEEFAPGIPKGREIHPLPKVTKPEEWMLAVQRHNADVAGEHLDLRLVDPQGRAHSWAIPKASLPRPGEKAVLAVPQPTHTAEYALTAGEKGEYTIPKGTYGAGTVKMDLKTPVEVYHSDPDHPTAVRFNLYQGAGPQEFAIVRTSSGSQILVNKTKTPGRLSHLPFGSENKPKMKHKAPEKVDLSNTSEVMMPKYDGAHTLLDLQQPGRIPRIFSYRIPKARTAGVIEHTHKVPTLLDSRVPEDLAGTVLRAELVGVDNRTGKAIPAKDLGGILNAAVSKSRETQKAMHAVMMPIALDIVKYRGKDQSSKPFSERLGLLRQVAERMGIQSPEVAETAAQKKKMLGEIEAGLHPLTNEGVILRELHEPPPEKVTKVKFRPDHDVYVRGVFQAMGIDGKPKDRAGGFTYSHTPTGKIVGRVGTGFSHQLAKDMLGNPGRYIGRVAKVEAETKFQSGALSKPAFKEWHLDKGRQI